MRDVTHAPRRRRLLIIGAHGFGRELLWTASEVPLERRDWDPAGFLDDDVDGARRRLAAAGVALPVLGAVRDHQPRSGEVFVCAVQAPRAKLVLCEMLRDRGAEFATVVHPTALVHPSASVGAGVVLRHYSGISPNAVVGDFVLIDSSGGPSHDTHIGDGCTLGGHSDVMGAARLGRGVLLGAHAVVFPGASIGDFAVVGAGSVVLRRVPSGVTVFGVPAKRLDFVPVAEPASHGGHR